MLKIEKIDIVVLLTALLMLAAYLKLDNAVFLYVFIVLLVADIFFMVKPKKQHAHVEN